MVMVLNGDYYNWNDGPSLKGYIPPAPPVTDSHNFSLNNTTDREDNNEYNSVQFNSKINGQIISISKQSNSAATIGVICNSVNTILGSAVFVGDIATFANPVTITSGTTYFASAGKNNATYQMCFAAGTGARARTNINYTGGGYYRGTFYSNYMCNIVSVVSRVT